MSTIPPLDPKTRPLPENDGVDHINICSHGKTLLGQLGTNFAHVPFRHPEFGFFASMEAYWYWIKTGLIHNQLRRLYGATAKTAGIRLPIVTMKETDFIDHMCDGMRCKVMQNAKLLDALKKSGPTDNPKGRTEAALPLRHYFVHASASGTVINEPKRNLWLWQCLEEIRFKLAMGEPIRLSNGAIVRTDPIKEVPENPVPEDMQRYIPRALEDEDNTRERED